MAELTDEQLALQLILPPGNQQRQEAEVQLRLRELKAQREATQVQREAIEAQRQAAEAGVRSAEAAERNANYMLASVIIAAIAAVFSAVSTGWGLR